MQKKIVFISDTHLVDIPHLPAGDLLVHSGDWCGVGPVGILKSDGKAQLEKFSRQLIEWKKLYPTVVVIAGNHDFIAEQDDAFTRTIIEAAGAIYLNDSGHEWYGVRLWGSPIQPWYHDWAFNRERGEEIRQHWDLIPDSTNILITHGPPFGILDQVCTGDKPHVGCEELLDVVQKIQPKIHVFGHIHEAYGQQHIGATHFINASSLSQKYEFQNPPIVVPFEVTE